MEYFIVDMGTWKGEKIGSPWHQCSVFHSTFMDGIVAYIMMLDLFKSRRLVASRMGNL